MIKKRTILLLLMLIFFCDCQSQNIGISYNERGADSTLYFEIENYMYLSSYEYYFSHFCFPSTIDTLFILCSKVCHCIVNSTHSPTISKNYWLLTKVLSMCKQIGINWWFFITTPSSFLLTNLSCVANSVKQDLMRGLPETVSHVMTGGHIK